MSMTTTEQGDLALQRVSGVGVISPDGGMISIPPGSDVIVPGPLQVRSHGAALGPLQFRTAAEETVSISSLAYPAATGDSTASDDGGWLGLSLVAGGGVAAIPEDPDCALTRRELMAGVAILAAGSAATGNAAAAGSGRTLATFELGRAPESELSIHPEIAAFVDSDAEWHVEREGRTIGTLTPDSAVPIPPGATGRYAVVASGEDGPFGIDLPDPGAWVEEKLAEIQRRIDDLLRDTNPTTEDSNNE